MSSRERGEICVLSRTTYASEVELSIRDEDVDDEDGIATMLLIGRGKEVVDSDALSETVASTVTSLDALSRVGYAEEDTIDTT
jgi:hypothetical protein